MIKRLTSALLGLACFLSVSAATIVHPWSCDTLRPASEPIALYQGETLSLAPVFRAAGTNIDTTGWSFSLCYQTNGMSNAWWTVPGTTFAPSNDVGAAAYVFFVRAVSADSSVSYRANGLIRMLKSPGFVPNALSLPVTALDFAGISITNAPWLLPSGTNGFLSAESDPVAYPIATTALAIAQVATNATAWNDYRIGTLAQELMEEQGVREAHEVQHLNLIADASSAATNYTDEAIGALTIPQTAADIGAAPDSITGTVSRLFGYLTGSNVWFSVTNYMRTVTNVVPKLSLHELRDGVNLTIWDQEEGLLDLWMQTTNHVASAIAGAMANVPDRAWSLYTSGTGAVAPSNTTWISTPTTVIAGGLEYAKFVTSAGFVCVLTSNGMTADLEASTNGYFRIAADDGTALLEFRKTASYTIGANGNSITTTDDADGLTHVFITYSTASSDHPTIYTRAALDSGTWIAETDSGCLYTVTWSGSSGAWLAEVTCKTKLATSFVKAEATIQGKVLLHSDAPASFGGGILCSDGIHYVRPVYTNNAVSWEVVP